METDLKEVLGELIQINQGKKTLIVSKQRAMIMRAMEKALKGDIRAVENLVKWWDQYLSDVDLDNQPLRADDRTIQERALARLSKRSADADEVDQ